MPSTSTSTSSSGVKRSRQSEKPKASSSSSSSKTSLSSSFSTLVPEGDFPRGGSTGLTPLEYRQTLREARAEAFKDEKDNLFKVQSDSKSNSKKAPQNVGITGDSEADAEEQDRKSKRKKMNRDKQNEKKKKNLLPIDQQLNNEKDGKKKEDHNRIEHLNYKRLQPGSKVLCTILAVHPLALILSLPNQLLGHVPITSISDIYTQRLQDSSDQEDVAGSEAEEDEEEGDETISNIKKSSTSSARLDSDSPPELMELYQPGQWVTASVVSVSSSNSKSGSQSNSFGFGQSGREGGEFEREAKRVELTLKPSLVNSGIKVTDLGTEFVLPVVIKSVEDHGYLLDSGISNVTGFSSFKDVPDTHHSRLPVGMVLPARITSSDLNPNSRSFTATLSPRSVNSATLSPHSNPIPSIDALLPGNLVQGLITASLPSGLNVKLFGMFDTTIDRSHLPPIPDGKQVKDVWKEGKKIKARILWDLGTSLGDAINEGEKMDRKFGLSAKVHVVEKSSVMVPSPNSIVEFPSKSTREAEAGSEGEMSKQEMISLHEAFPIGTKLNATVNHSSSDWGLEVSCSLPISDGLLPRKLPFPLQGFVHISKVSDDHVVSLSTKSGSPFTIGSNHEARVIGHALTDGLLLLDFRPSTLSKLFLKVSDVEIGSILKCTIKSVQQSGIFLDLNGSTDGVVFPLHFSDLVSPNSSGGANTAMKLSRLEKKFKIGSTIRARVLDVQPEKNRITLTLKKSLVTSELEPLAHLEQAFVGRLAHGVVSKFLPSNSNNALGGSKSSTSSGPVLVDFFGGLRALLPPSEISDSFVQDVRSHFGGAEGKVVKVRITNVDMINGRLICSIRQAQNEFQSKLNVDSVEIGEKVVGSLVAVHQDVVVMTLEKNDTRALISLKILAKIREMDQDQLRESLLEGEKIDNLEVVIKNKEKGIVILGEVGTTQKALNKNEKNQTKKNQGDETSSISLRVGSIHNAKVIGLDSEPNVISVLLPNKCKGRLHLVDTKDDYDELLPRENRDPNSKFKPVDRSHLPKLDSTIEVCILNLKNSNRKADVSTRPSVIARSKGQPSSSSSIKDPEIPCENKEKAIRAISQGMEIRGFVRNVSDGGLFVDLAANLTARVKIKEIEDGFTKDWKKGWKKEMLVKGTVLSIDPKVSRVELSLRSTPSNETKSALKKAKYEAQQQAEGSVKKLSDFSKGDKVKGFIRGKSDFGVFVQVEGTDVSGLCHKSQLSDSASMNDALQAFEIGDKVKAIVLEVQKEKKKISFGLKPSYFEDEDFDDEDDEEKDGAEDTIMANGDDDDEEEEDDDDQEEGSQDEDDDEEEEEMDASALLKQAGLDGRDGNEDEEVEDSQEESDEEMQDAEEDGESDEGDDYIEMDQDEEAPVSKSKDAPQPSIPALELAGGFSWSARDDEEENGLVSSESESDEEEEEGATAKRSNRRKKASKGKAIQEDVTADLATKTPTSSTDFERLLLGSPNSSYLWIQFMSFRLQLSDVQRAREVARRALRVINFREEQEKLNVWIALLNLENSYGSVEEREKAFKEAVQANDAKTIYLRMNDILEKTGKVQEAEENWKKTTKKFGHSSKVWSGFAAFYLRQQKFEEARMLIPRSMQSLEKRKHVKTILAFALGEFRLGDPERGRTVFEGLVDSYPKRLDLWWQYIDQEAKVGNVSAARALFDRVLSLKQSSKKAKSILKKWLAFEKKSGDSKGEQEVLKRARDFVEEMKKKEMESAEAEAEEGDDRV